MFELFTNPAYHNGLIMASALGVACAMLSVLVVLRRWAFIGEGISHAGFGGVGTAWLLSLAFPVLGNEAAAYGVAVAFCLAMALTIGWVSRRDRFGADAAIGIVLVASLSWGFVAMSIYDNAGRPNGSPSGWEFYLLGDVLNLPKQAMLAGLAISALVVGTLVLLAKEILFYCMDPELAQVSGVRTGLIHYLLMVMLALVIVVGMRLAGYLLVTALLVLPGATALMVARRLRNVVIAAIVISLIGTIGGLAAKAAMPFLRSGPAMVLILALVFGAANLYRVAFRR